MTQTEVNVLGKMGRGCDLNLYPGGFHLISADTPIFVRNSTFFALARNGYIELGSSQHGLSAECLHWILTPKGRELNEEAKVLESPAKKQLELGVEKSLTTVKKGG